jgi:AraC-like DNA-binding protein
MEKPYMDPNINLMDLGQQVGIPHRSLSEVINNALQQNFYDFINSYRVRESERLLKESEQYKTVLEVLYEVGFNSKSAFHTAFKKTTGMTPTQFKRVNRN